MCVFCMRFSPNLVFHTPRARLAAPLCHDTLRIWSRLAHQGLLFFLENTVDFLIFLIVFGMVIMLLPYILAGAGAIIVLIAALFAWIWEKFK